MKSKYIYELDFEPILNQADSDSVRQARTINKKIQELKAPPIKFEGDWVYIKNIENSLLPSKPVSAIRRGEIIAEQRRSPAKLSPLKPSPSKNMSREAKSNSVLDVSTLLNQARNSMKIQKLSSQKQDVQQLRYQKVLELKDSQRRLRESFTYREQEGDSFPLNIEQKALSQRAIVQSIYPEKPIVKQTQEIIKKHHKQPKNASLSRKFKLIQVQHQLKQHFLQKVNELKHSDNTMKKHFEDIERLESEINGVQTVDPELEAKHGMKLFRTRSVNYNNRMPSAYQSLFDKIIL